MVVELFHSTNTETHLRTSPQTAPHRRLESLKLPALDGEFGDAKCQLEPWNLSANDPDYVLLTLWDTDFAWTHCGHILHKCCNLSAELKLSWVAIQNVPKYVKKMFAFDVSFEDSSSEIWNHKAVSIYLTSSSPTHLDFCRFLAGSGRTTGLTCCQEESYTSWGPIF